MTTMFADWGDLRRTTRSRRIEALNDRLQTLIEELAEVSSDLNTEVHKKTGEIH